MIGKASEIKTVTCFVCGSEYQVDVKVKAAPEDWICRKKCLDKAEGKSS
jgi:hypothetical protein